MSTATKFVAALIRHPINLAAKVTEQIAHDIEVLNQQEAAAKLVVEKGTPAASIAEIDEEQLQAELRRRAAMRKAQQAVK